MLKARLGTHSGTVTELFAPYHVSLEVTRKSEISDEIIMKTISSASGTKINVIQGENTRNPTPSSSVITGQRAAPKPTSTNSTKTPAAPKLQDSAIKFTDKDAVLQDIKEVRTGSINWVLVGYEGKKGNTIVTLGKGEGGVAELAEHLTDDIAAYGLVKKTDKIDQSLTTKFALISWLGDNTDRMHKARLGTHKGAVAELFAPYSVDLNTNTKGDVTDDNIHRIIQENSGTRSKVKQ